MFRPLPLLFAILRLIHFPAAAEEFGPYAEPDFPVLTSTVDFSDWEKLGFPKNNIAVRGLIIKLPHDLYVCFGQDLLRVAGIWQGEPGGKFLTYTTIPAISYNIPNKKSEPGQKDLPKPIGKPIMATGLMPGWILKTAKDIDDSGLSDLADPRSPGPDATDPGRGPLHAPAFRWEGYRLGRDAVVLRYQCGNTLISESFAAGLLDDQPVVRRRITRQGSKDSLSLITGNSRTMKNTPNTVIVQETKIISAPDKAPWDIFASRTGITAREVERATMEFTSKGWDTAHWKEDVVVKSVTGPEGGALAVDNIPLPIPNPWKRNVRPSGIAFPSGKRPPGVQANDIAFICTIDGDVWSVTGLADPAGVVRWNRIASGLHEPQSIVCKDFSHIFVFTRDGIVRLNHFSWRSGEYENFCNAFTQTGETREYAMDMVAKPGGGFYIAKGGQMITRKTPQGGHVLEISADGRTVTDICSGLRQPYLGIHPKTGLLTASDQQGHWTPSTPIRYIRKGAYYGFEEAAPNPIPSVIDPPACWIPHEVNQSAAGQVWCVDAKMGPLNDRLLHLMYYHPGILTAFLDPDKAQAAVVPTGLNFDFPLLKGAINPADGLLYVCGFRIWGTESKEVGGLARIKPTGKPSGIPAAVRAVPQGIHLRFPDKIDAMSLKPENFAAARWNYKRTSGYGSAHYKLDGTPGMDPLPCTGVQISSDGCGLLVHLPDMKPAEQYRLDWHLQSAAGAHLASFACLTLYTLVPFDAAAAGFDPGFTPSAPPPISAAAEEEPTMEAGKQLITTLGCLACHSTDGKMEGMKGPTWKDLYGSENELTTGKKATADDAYLRNSILNPAATVRKGFATTDTGMPPYAGILSDSQMESILLYLHSLSSQ